MKPSVLFLTTSSNWPLTDGKRQRTWFLIEALSKDYDVDVLLMGFESDKKQIEASTSSIKNFYYIALNDSKFLQPGYPSFLLSKKQKQEKINFFNKVHAFFSHHDVDTTYSFLFSRYLPPVSVVPLFLKIKIVCDIDDVYFETQSSRIREEHHFLTKLKLKVLFYLGTRAVQKTIKKITIPIIVKETDRTFFGLQNAICLTNLPFGFYVNQKENLLPTKMYCPEALRFGFIGKLSYRPNYQGLIDFIETVWKPLMQSGFDSRFLIAGSGEVPKSLLLAINSTSNIDLLGFVDTPDVFWNQISVLLVPVAEGGGTTIKIAEAFIHGKTVIANEFSARGYEAFISDACFLLPKTTKEWIETLSEQKNTSEKQIHATALKARTLFDLQQWNQTLLTVLN